MPGTTQRKFDARLSAALLSAEPARKFDVTVRLRAPLIEQKVSVLQKLGVRADVRKLVCYGRLDAEGLRRLAQEPAVQQVSLVQQLAPVASSS